MKNPAPDFPDPPLPASPPLLAGALDGPEGRPLRVLMAEDHIVNQKVAVGMLRALGHSSVVVGDGRQAVRAWEAGGFDLILMDVEMPEMDGFEAVAAIRRSEQRAGGHVPIVALTAHAMNGDRDRCLGSGFDGLLSKPVRSAELIEAIARLSSPVTESPTGGGSRRPRTRSSTLRWHWPPTGGTNSSSGK